MLLVHYPILLYSNNGPLYVLYLQLIYFLLFYAMAKIIILPTVIVLFTCIIIYVSLIRIGTKTGSAIYVELGL